MNQNSMITFTDENNNEITYEVWEETVLQGKTYLLVAEESDDAEEAECYIMVRMDDNEDDNYCTYEFVEDENELESVFKIFETLLSEEDLEG